MGKCMECGKETDKFLWSREEDRNKYSSGDLYLCDDCRNKRRDLYDWQNEQFEMEEIVCPWCGYEYQGLTGDTACIIALGKEDVWPSDYAYLSWYRMEHMREW